MNMLPLGGAWHLYLHQSFMIEAGRRPSDLYREWKGRTVLVASDVAFHEYYKAPDCMLWEGGYKTYIVYAACGDREPIIVSSDDYHRWKMEPRGLVDEGSARVNAEGAPVKPTVIFPIDDIAAASERQPAFSGKWRPESARGDDELAPTELEVTIGVNDTTEIGRTPLMEAAKSADMPIASSLALVNSLIEHGADVNAADNYGFTALMIAADSGNVRVVRRVIEAGANIHARNNRGRTALMEAAGSLENQIEMVTMLLEAGADKNVRDQDGRTAFSAIRTNTDPQLKVLLALK